MDDDLHQKLLLAAEYGQKLLQQNAALQQEINELKTDLKRKVCEIFFFII